MTMASKHQYCLILRHFTYKTKFLAFLLKSGSLYGNNITVGYPYLGRGFINIFRLSDTLIHLSKKYLINVYQVPVGFGGHLAL